MALRGLDRHVRALEAELKALHPTAEVEASFTKYRDDPVGFVEEVPGANSQGATLDEARRNLDEEEVAHLGDRRRFGQKNRDRGEDQDCGEDLRGQFDCFGVEVFQFNMDFAERFFKVKIFIDFFRRDADIAPGRQAPDVDRRS